MAIHNDLGNEGEQTIVNFLIEAGYKIEATNWRYRRNEIDIIASDDDTIIFVEVKTRSSEVWGTPESFLSDSQIDRLVETANYYLEKYEIDKEIRFDVFSLTKSGDEFNIEHFPDFLIP